MERPKPRASFPLLLLLAGVLCLGGCSQKDAEELDTASEPGTDVVATEAGNGAITEPGAGEEAEEDFSKMSPDDLLKRARKLDKEQRDEWDRLSRGYIKSFESRVYEPRRDGSLLGIEAKATIRVGDREATYDVLFDAGREKNEMLSVRRLTAAEGMPAGIDKTVRRWSAHGLAGAYNTVVYYLPPIPLIAQKSRVTDAFLAIAPPYRHETSVTYSFDARELITKRGAARKRDSEIAHFEWELWRGRYVLHKITFHGTDSDVVFDYSEHDGVLLLDRAQYRKKTSTWDVTFDYTRITKR